MNNTKSSWRRHIAEFMTGFHRGGCQESLRFQNRDAAVWRQEGLSLRFSAEPDPSPLAVLGQKLRGLVAVVLPGRVLNLGRQVVVE